MEKAFDEQGADSELSLGKTPSEDPKTLERE
jgi:hypothetical protein